MLVTKSLVLATSFLMTAAAPIADVHQAVAKRFESRTSRERQNHSSSGTVPAQLVRNVTGSRDAPAAPFFSWSILDMHLKLMDRASGTEYISMDLYIRGSTRFTSIRIGKRISPELSLSSKGRTKVKQYQQFDLAFDSASRWTFVAGLNCGANCNDREPKYDPRLNMGPPTDLQLPFHVPSTDGYTDQVTGNLFLDTIEGIGQYFGAATAFSEHHNKRFFPVHGAISIRYQPAEKRPDLYFISFVWGLVGAGMIVSPEVTFEPVDWSTGRSKVSFGRHPEYPPLITAKVLTNHNNYWKVYGELSVNRGPFSGPLILRTGVPWTELSSPAVTEIYKLIPSAREVNRRYIKKCSDPFPPISLAIGDNISSKTRRLQPAQSLHNIQPSNDPALGPNECYGAFVVSRSGIMVIGDTMLSSFTVNLNLQQGTVNIS